MVSGGTPGPRASAQVTAAVLLWRAVTYLPPIPLGAAAFLVWRHAPALLHPTPGSAGPTRVRRRVPRAAATPGVRLHHPQPVPAADLACEQIRPGPAPAA